jgi:precorrin-2 dehydrogenase/sirohydrochlorin ferrochelatase
MPVDEPLYPVGLRLAGHSCLVVGGGPVALSKVQGLLEADAVVTVVAPEIDPRLDTLAGNRAVTAGAGAGAGAGAATAAGEPGPGPGRDGSGGGPPPVTVLRRSYRPGDLDGRRLVIAATDDPEVNHGVARDAEARGLLVNVADDPRWCGFVLPARVRRGPLLITYATGGTSPALARWLRRRGEKEFGQEYEILVQLLSDARSELQRLGRPTEGLGWQEALDSGMLELIREGNLAEAREHLQRCLSSSSG